MGTKQRKPTKKRKTPPKPSRSLISPPENFSVEPYSYAGQVPQDLLDLFGDDDVQRIFNGQVLVGTKLA